MGSLWLQLVLNLEFVTLFHLNLIMIRIVYLSLVQALSIGYVNTQDNLFIHGASVLLSTVVMCHGSLVLCRWEGRVRIV